MRPLSSSVSPARHCAMSSRVSVSRSTRRPSVAAGARSGQAAGGGASKRAGPWPSRVKRAWRLAAQFGISATGLAAACGMGPELDVQHRAEPAQALRADAQRVDPFMQLDAQGLFRRQQAGPQRSAQRQHIQRFHQAFLGQLHGLRRCRPRRCPGCRAGTSPRPARAPCAAPSRPRCRPGSAWPAGPCSRSRRPGRHGDRQRVAWHDAGMDDRGVLSRVLGRPNSGSDTTDARSGLSGWR